MPGPFIYQNNIPAANDELSVSQGDILTNFASIQSIIEVNHNTFADTDAGKHKWITFPTQAAIPPAGSAFSATEIGLFNAVSNGQQELFVNKTSSVGPVTSNVPFTRSTFSTNPTPLALSNGYTYLPSGLILQWGQYSQAAGSTVAFSIPFPNVCIQVITGNYATAVVNVGASAFNQNNFTLTTSTGAAGSGTYIALGY